MNVQFEPWLLLVGLVVGVGLAWLVIADIRRRDDDVDARERKSEAIWIAAEMTAHGIAADAEAVEEVLRLHRQYLAGVPLDAVADESPRDEPEPAGTPERPAPGDQRKDARPLS
jgi:hypothetical protein